MTVRGWRKVVPGAIVAITFLDHVEDGSETIPFVVYGRVVKKDRKELTLDSWEYQDVKIPHDDNEKRFSIVRGAVTRVRVLEEVDGKE